MCCIEYPILTKVSLAAVGCTIGSPYICCCQKLWNSVVEPDEIICLSSFVWKIEPLVWVTLNLCHDLKVLPNVLNFNGALNFQKQILE